MLRSQGRFAEMRAKNGDLHHILFFQFTEGQPGNGAVTELIEGKDQADACAVLDKLVDVSGRACRKFDPAFDLMQLEQFINLMTNVNPNGEGNQILSLQVT